MRFFILFFISFSAFSEVSKEQMTAFQKLNLSPKSKIHAVVEKKPVKAEKSKEPKHGRSE